MGFKELRTEIAILKIIALENVKVTFMIIK
jgi:hypothetical protein